MQTLEGHAAIVSRLAYTPDNRFLISASHDGTTMIWDVATGTLQRTLKGHRQNVFALAVAPHGNIIATGAGTHMKPGGELKLWDLPSGQEQPAWPVISGVTDLSYSPDGKFLAVANFNEELCVWDVTKRETKLKLGHARMAVAVAYSRDGARIATGSFDGTIAIWEAKTGHKLLTLSGHSRPVVSLGFSLDGKMLASAGGDGTVKLWNAGTNATASSSNE